MCAAPATWAVSLVLIAGAQAPVLNPGGLPVVADTTHQYENPAGVPLVAKRPFFKSKLFRASIVPAVLLSSAPILSTAAVFTPTKKPTAASTGSFPRRTTGSPTT